MDIDTESFKEVNYNFSTESDSSFEDLGSIKSSHSGNQISPKPKISEFLYEKYQNAYGVEMAKNPLEQIERFLKIIENSSKKNFLIFLDYVLIEAAKFPQKEHSREIGDNSENIRSVDAMDQEKKFESSGKMVKIEEKSCENWQEAGKEALWSSFSSIGSQNFQKPPKIELNHFLKDITNLSKIDQCYDPIFSIEKYFDHLDENQIEEITFDSPKKSLENYDPMRKRINLETTLLDKAFIKRAQRNLETDWTSRNAKKIKTISEKYLNGLKTIKEPEQIKTSLFTPQTDQAICYNTLDFLEITNTQVLFKQPGLSSLKHNVFHGVYILSMKIDSLVEGKICKNLLIFTEKKFYFLSSNFEILHEFQKEDLYKMEKLGKTAMLTFQYFNFKPKGARETYEVDIDFLTERMEELEGFLMLMFRDDNFCGVGGNGFNGVRREIGGVRGDKEVIGARLGQDFVHGKMVFRESRIKYKEENRCFLEEL